MSRCPPGVQCRGVIPALSHIMLQSDTLAHEYNYILNAVQTFAPFQPLDPAVVFHAPLSLSLRDLRLNEETFQRTGAAYYRTANGLLVPVASNVPRFESTALLLEPAATNFVYPSNGITTAPWGGGSDPVISASVLRAPDGSFSAWRIDDTGGPSSADPLEVARIFSIHNAGTIANARYSASGFFAKTTKPTTVFPVFGFSLTGGATSLFSLISFDPATGEATICDNTGWSGSITIDGWEVEDFGAWWRFTVYGWNTAGGNNTYRWRLYPAYSSTLGGVANAGLIGGIDFWQADLALERTVSSAIVTTSSPANRGADAVEWEGGWFPQSAGMALFEWRPGFNRAEVTLSTNTQIYYLSLRRTGTEQLCRSVSNTSNFNLQTDTGSATAVTSLASPHPIKGTIYPVAVRWSTGGAMEIGIKTDDVWKWGGGSYSGSYPSDGILALNDRSPVINRFKNISVWNEDRGRAWIEANFGVAA